MSRCGARAFTLIELLVVVTIIVILIALLTPALDRAMESAQRVACAANLHAMGGGVAQYYLQNRRKLMRSVGTPCNGCGLYPFALWGRVGEPTDTVNVDTPAGYVGGGGWNAYSRTAIQAEAQWNAEAINPYLGNPVDLDTHHVGKVFECPAAAVPAFWLAPYGLYGTHYSYYARVSQWPAGAAANSAPRDLIDRDLAPGRLLMSDWLHFNSTSVAFDYNHPGARESATVTEWEGMNHLNGDGSVGWKSGEGMPKTLMSTRDVYPDGYVQAPGTSGVYY